MSEPMSFEEAFQAADVAVRAVRMDGLRDIERVVLQGSWNRQTYQEIASDAGYTEGYLSRDVGPALWTTLSDALGMQVKKTNFRTAIERWSKTHNTAQMTAVAMPEANGHGNAEGWVDANTHDDPDGTDINDLLSFDIADFRGREPLLTDLASWIVNDRGRLLCLSGMPGVGKTWFAIKLGEQEQVRSHFRRFIFQDLSDKPSPHQLVTSLLNRLQITPIPEASFRECLDLLIKTLTHRPTLVILDNTEIFCRPKAFAGTYDAAFEDCRQLLESLASHDHQSCVLWIGREFPRTVAPMASSSCRFLALVGLAQKELSTLVSWPQDIQAMEADWQHLSVHYGGLPALILSEVAPRMSSFGNNLKACLAALQRDSHSIRTYLENWLAPLSDEEWRILTWFMISHRPLSLAQISDYSQLSMPLGAIESLCDRGICRPVMMGAAHWEIVLPDLLNAYLCDRFLGAFQAAEESQRIQMLQDYPLIQADAPEMVRQWQRQTFLVAIAETLKEAFPNRADQQLFLQNAIEVSQEVAQLHESRGYGAGNLMNISQCWQVSLVDFDLRGLDLRDADLQSDLFQGVSFADVDFSDASLAKPMGQSPVIAMNPTQPQAAVGDRDGRLLVWNTQDGRLNRAMLMEPEAICTIAFSYDGATLVESRQNKQIRLWDLNSEYGPELFPTDLAGTPTVVLFSPDKQWLAGGDDEGYLYLWRLDSGSEAHRIRAHEASVSAITFSPCSRRLVTCGQDCTAVEWEVQTGQMLNRFQGRLMNLLGTVAYVPTDSGVQAVVIGRDEERLVIWDIASARPLRVMNDPCDLFMAMALSPDGRYVAVSDISNTVSIWEVKSRERLHQISALSAPAESLIFSPDGRELMTGCDYIVQRWDVSSGHCLRIWRSDRHPATNLSLATRPLQLLSSHDDQTLRCWQFSMERQRWLPQERLQIPGQGLVSAVATSIQGRYWAVGTESGRIHIWNRDKQLWLSGTMRMPNAVTTLAFSDDEVFLAAGGAQGTLMVWNLPENMRHWQKKQAHTDRITTLTFSPNGEHLFSGSRDRTIKSWDSRGDDLFTLSGHRRRVHTLCLSADGNTLYSGSYDGTIRHWNLRDQKCTSDWQRDNWYIYRVTLDAQNNPVAIISDTQMLEIWDIVTNTCRTTLSPHEETIWHISTSPDSQAVVCAGQNGAIGIWSLNSGAEEGILRVDRPYEGMQIGGSVGLTEPERQMLYSLGATEY